MNKRIKELAVKAGAGQWGDSVIAATMDIEKFAELIVIECASVAFQFSMENKRFHPDFNPQNMTVSHRLVYHSTCQAVGHEIKQHFGVE